MNEEEDKEGSLKKTFVDENLIWVGRLLVRKMLTRSIIFFDQNIWGKCPDI
jgi:hypothetical protein